MAVWVVHSAYYYQQSRASEVCTKVTQGRGSCPERQGQSTAAGLCLYFAALSPHAVCQVQTSAVKVIWVLAAVTERDLYLGSFPLEGGAALRAYDLAVAVAGLVRCPQTALNLLCHWALASAVGLCHPDACLAQWVASGPAPACHC